MLEVLAFFIDLSGFSGYNCYIGAKSQSRHGGIRGIHIFYSGFWLLTSGS